VSALASSLKFQQLKKDGVLSPIHQAFGETVQRLDAVADSDVVLAAVLCSEQLARGHVCLDLSDARSIVFPTLETNSRIRQYDNWPEEAEWVDKLQKSTLVTVADSEADQDSISTPLVLDAARSRLYLARYWYFEQKLVANIAERLKQEPIRIDELLLQREIAQLFPDRENIGSRDQCLAVGNSVDRWFSIITGGPGTGKTTTVARLLALRLSQHLATGNDPAELKILLMAPTGKAAQRLNESLSHATQQLAVDAQVYEALRQVSAGTIHRLLGWTPHPPERGGPFRHRKEVPLEVDIVLVDEASMVDLALMCRLFDAIPKSAQIILIGDRDQLASVEAGGVFSDLCGTLIGDTLDRLDDSRQAVIAQRTGLQSTRTSLAESLSPDSRSKRQVEEPLRKKKASRRKKKPNPNQMTLFGDDDKVSEYDAEPVAINREGSFTRESLAVSTDVLTESVATLNYSHRFSAESSLGQLAAAIREGRADGAVTLLRNADPNEIHWLDGSGKGGSSVDVAIAQAADGYRGYLEQLGRKPIGSKEVLQAAAQVRVLTALHSGLRGEAILNQRIADRLMADGLLNSYAGDQLGRLVMVARNNYRLDLFNGDVGVVAMVDHDSISSNSSGRGRVVIFEDGNEDSGIRRVPAALVPGVRDCFAMTIHRSQGSEFRQVLLVLPEHDSPVLSRELLYTAVTRVKASRDAAGGAALPGFLSIAGSESVLRGAISRCNHRVSGLREGVEDHARLRPKVNP